MDLDEEVEAPPKGITTAHYIKFINELFDVMDRDETIKEYYWVMDNATIQESLPMQRKIESGTRDCIQQIATRWIPMHNNRELKQYLTAQMLQQRTVGITLTRTIITGEPHIKMDSNAHGEL
ncbi:hypothetical protein [Parasitella parasitica]|uniref:Uncharacterized protein n=1 Tax=Parasitella parasitica TaxID=35722 RepID=A0A0B7NJ54_9FUNG|nr:hypothetical protein [Parasitella parasitica]